MNHHLIPIPPGFDPEGLRVYRDGAIVGLAASYRRGDLITVREIDRVVHPFVSLDDPRTHDALWRWARERMGWP
jgi:hypothetical protein